jgi:hypothetical protein
MLDLNSPDDDPKHVTISNYPGDMSELDFHGMSVWVDQSGESNWRSSTLFYFCRSYICLIKYGEYLCHCSKVNKWILSGNELNKY